MCISLKERNRMERRVLMISAERKMDSLDGKMEDTDEEAPIGELNGEDEKTGMDE